VVTLGPGDKLLSGVPLGGIGAGKVEINNKGKMVNLTFLNNWSFPIPIMRAFHVLVRPDDGEPFFVEYGLPIKKFFRYEPDSMTYTGKYPFATLNAKKGNVEVTMEVFSSIIPHNLEDSVIPAFGMSIKVKGSKGGKIAVSASNNAGTNAIGRANVSVEGGVKFMNAYSNDYDGARGEHCLLAANPAESHTQFNLNVPPGVAWGEALGKYSWESDRPWLSIINGMPFEDDPHEVLGQWDDPAGMVVTKYVDGSEAKYVFSWYTTGKWVFYPYGHYYHNRFKGAEEVGNYMLSEFDRLRRQSREWHDTMVRKDLPEWLRDAIINSTYILSSSTWLDEQGRFSAIEGTKNDRQLGSISGMVYEAGSLPILKMFPELERKFLETSAKYARDDGYVLHDFGILSLDHPTGCSRYPPGRKDECSTFNLLVYRYAKWTNDLQFLRDTYPKMMKALEWDLRQDRDGDGLPDLEGQADSSFDAFPRSGRESYVSSIFLASLIAMREAAKLLGKNEDVERISKLLAKGKQSFSELFNGRYFEAWTGEPSSKGYLFMGQLGGEWWTNILGLESFTEAERSSSAFDQLYNISAQASRYCTPNLVHESGRISDMSIQAYTSWPRMVFALSAVRYRLGDKKWLEVAKKEWDNLLAHGLAWDHPSRVDSRTGGPDPNETYFLDHYLGSPALWTFTL
jgi:non-lysosomal glucosylceramidase